MNGMNVIIVVDMLRVMANYIREVINRVRVDRALALRDHSPGRRVVKGARWRLPKSRRPLSPDVGLQQVGSLQKRFR